ncbi:VOC family protein [Erythrobacter sp.]|jgi:catechol 2,3-dioxygenase-like lactoylglutathione lyase family enzyme|uniref:VOC family protein n=1 Tax=Erythrobacter sp. TaxID=1042 RepID=UPI002EC14CB8|nr:VOC family protein [Erythrobacter sp.]
MSAPSTKAIDLDHVRFRVPDLGAQSAFLSDFGFAVEHEGDRLIGVVGDGTPAYRAEAGDARFLGFGLRVPGEGDLDRLEASGAKRADDRGTRCAALRDPDGWEIRAVVRESASQDAGIARNEGGRFDRGTGRYAPPRGPAHIMRLGHIVLQVGDFQASSAFYQDTFGLLASDEVETPDGSTLIGAFLRCDRGPSPADHHSVFLMQSPDGKARFEHAAFEVRDIDSLMAGHEHLLEAKRDHAWGPPHPMAGNR